jgi:1,4-dihydroxy-2-naphthoate octaprenyltransferase
VASAREWVEGARPRTLPAALAPVLVGTAVAAYEQGAVLARALLALLVALALQVGVNYANDYSDGIRGTDEVRVGPVRLVGQGLARPRAVRAAALTSFAVAGCAGLALVVLTQAWWLLAVGAAAIVAAWTYTGGPRPYGYAGLGELFVFLFFGVVAVVGTAYVQTGTVSALAGALSVGTGLVTVAVLVANNLRDIPGDRAHGKRTTAVQLGDRRTRTYYVGVLAVGYLVPAAVGVAGLAHPRGGPWPVGALLVLASGPLALPLVRTVRSGAVGAALVPVLSGTGRLVLAYGVTLAAGVALSGYLR